MHPATRRWSLRFSALAILSVAACSAPAEESTENGADDLSLSNLVKLARGTIDRTVVDPANPWAQKKLAIGEENRLPNEAAEFATFAKLVNRIQANSQAELKAKAPFRAFHAKPHACVRGTATLDNRALPASARVGLFATNASYPTWARFSGGVSTPQPDKKLDIHGLALKFVGVPGARILTQPGDDTATTQDFLFTDQSVAPASDARHMMAFAEASLGVADNNSILGKFENLAAVGAFLTRDENVRIVDFLVNRALPKTRSTGSLLGDTFYSGAPMALGLEAGDVNTAKAKGAFKLIAKTGVLRNGVCSAMPTSPNTKDDAFLHNDLVKRFGAETVCIDLSIQIQQDPNREVLEDVSVEWRNAAISVGRITFESRKLGEVAADAEQATCDAFSFFPWHTIADHRPLGNAMRARRVAMPSSAGYRDATTPEPTATAPTGGR